MTSDQKRQQKHLEQRLCAPNANKITSTSILDRGRIFLPSLVPAFRDTMQSPDVVPSICTTCVVGRLGQMHAAVLESILLRRTHKDEKNGVVVLQVPLAAVLKDLSPIRDYSHVHVKTLLDELVNCHIHLSEFGDTWAKYKNIPAPAAVEGPLLSNVAFEAEPIDQSGSRFPAVQLVVTLSPALLAILRHDRAPTRRLERLATVHLKSGQSRACARWLLSQKTTKQPNGGWHIDTVLAAVLGSGLTPTQLAKSRAAICAEAEWVWNACGIVFPQEGAPKTRRFQLLPIAKKH